MIDFGLPSLRPDRLSTFVPTATYGGGSIADTERLLLINRTVATEQARGATLGFFMDDERFECL